MARSIGKRVISLIKAEVAAFIDEADRSARDDAPTRKLNGLIGDIRSRLGEVLVERHQAGKSLTDIRGQLIDLAPKAELAIEADREDLARAALTKRAALEAEEMRIEGDLTALDAERRDLESLIADLKIKLSTDGQASETKTLAAQLEELNQLVGTDADKHKPTQNKEENN